MVCAPVRSIIPSLKLGDYLSVQAQKPCSISHSDSNFLVFKGVNFQFGVGVPVVDKRLTCTCRGPTL